LNWLRKWATAATNLPVTSKTETIEALSISRGTNWEKERPVIDQSFVRFFKHYYPTLFFLRSELIVRESSKKEKRFTIKSFHHLKKQYAQPHKHFRFVLYRTYGILTG
jgi:hypothetical protein